MTLKEILDKGYARLLKITRDEKYVVEVDHDYFRVLAKHLSGAKLWSKEEKLYLDEMTGWLCELMIETPLGRDKS